MALLFVPYFPGDDSRKVPIEEEFEIKDELGDGGYSVVKKGIRKDDGRLFAIKVIKKTKVGPRDLEREVRIWRLACSSSFRVVHLYEIYEDAVNVNLVMELMAGGELFAKIVQMEDYSEKYAGTIIKQLLLIIKDLHKVNIIHQDLKPENLLLRDKNEMDIKVCDFGLAEITEDHMELVGVVGSSTYMAPEVVAKTGHSKPVDIYSCGVIMYILLCGYPPFEPENGIVHLEFPEPEWADISDAAKDLIEKMLNSDPYKRPKPEVALKHPWFTDVETLKEVRPLYGTIKTLKRFREIDFTKGSMKEYRGRDRNSLFTIFAENMSENETHSASKDGDGVNSYGNGSTGKGSITASKLKNDKKDNNNSNNNSNNNNNNDRNRNFSPKQDSSPPSSPSSSVPILNVSSPRKSRTSKVDEKDKNKKNSDHNNSNTTLGDEMSPRGKKTEESEKPKKGLRFSANITKKDDGVISPKKKDDDYFDESIDKKEKKIKPRNIISESNPENKDIDDSLSSEQISQPTLTPRSPNASTVNISSLLSAGSPGSSRSNSKRSPEGKKLRTTVNRKDRSPSSPPVVVHNPEKSSRSKKDLESSDSKKKKNATNSASGTPTSPRKVPPLNLPVSPSDKPEDELTKSLSEFKKSKKERVSPSSALDASVEKKPRKTARLSLPIIPLQGLDISLPKSPRKSVSTKSTDKNEEKELQSKKSGRFTLPATKSPDTSNPKLTPRGENSKSQRDIKSSVDASSGGTKTPRELPRGRKSRESTSKNPISRESASGARSPRESHSGARSPRESTSGARSPHESNSGKSPRDSSLESSTTRKSRDENEKKSVRSGGKKDSKSKIPRTSKRRADIKKQARTKKRRSYREEKPTEGNLAVKNSEERELSTVLDTESREDQNSESRDSPSKESRKTRTEPKSSIFGGFIQSIFKSGKPSNTPQNQVQQQVQQPFLSPIVPHDQQLILGVANSMKSIPVDDDLELKILRARAEGQTFEREKISTQVLHSLVSTLRNNKEELDRLWQGILKMKFLIHEEAVRKQDLHQRMKLQLQLLHQTLKQEQEKRKLLEKLIEHKLLEKEAAAREDEQREKSTEKGGQNKASRAVRIKKSARHQPTVPELLDVMKQGTDS